MKGKGLVLATVFLFALITGCSPQTVEEAQVEYCQALVAYGQSVRALQDVSAATTVDELQTARDDVQEARGAVVNAAADLREAQIRGVEGAWKNVQAEISGISGDATLGEAAARIRGQATTLSTEIERISNVSCGRR